MFRGLLESYRLNFYTEQKYRDFETSEKKFQDWLHSTENVLNLNDIGRMSDTNLSYLKGPLNWGAEPLL